MVKQITYKIALAALSLLLAFSTPAGTLGAAPGLTPGDIALKLQESYDKSTRLSADFKQMTIINVSGRLRQGEGTVVFLKPGRMRWDYYTPVRQVMISDGETITMYFEKDKQMIITSAREYLQSDVTYSFFAGSGKLQRDFNVMPPDRENDGDHDDYLIKLVPKALHPQIDYLYVWVDRESFLINRLQIIDYFDTITDIFFKNIQINTPPGSIDDRVFFNFVPPPGTEVIRQ